MICCLTLEGNGSIVASFQQRFPQRSLKTISCRRNPILEFQGEAHRHSEIKSHQVRLLVETVIQSSAQLWAPPRQTVFQAGQQDPLTLWPHFWASGLLSPSECHRRRANRLLPVV